MENEKRDDANEISDEQLDALLRSVEVPGDLKAQLLSIADPTNDELSSKAEDSNAAAIPASEPAKGGQPTPTRSWIGYVLAASLMFVLAYAGWQWWGGKTLDPNGIAEVEQNQLVSPSPSDGLAKAEDVDPDQKRLQEALERIQRNRVLVEEQLQIAELANARAAAERQTGNQSRLNMKQRDFESMVLAMADQVVIPLGGSEESAKTDMANVIKNYPGSKGASIAREFLEQKPN